MSDTQPAENSPAVIDKEGNTDIAIPAVLDPRKHLSAVWSSIKPTDMNGQAKLLAMVQGQLPKLATVINAPLQVTDVILQTVTLVDRTSGEVSSGVRSVVVCKDGSAYSAVSDGIRSSLGMLFQLVGMPPWNPPLPLRMRQIETGTGKRYFMLDLDADAAAAAAVRAPARK